MMNPMRRVLQFVILFSQFGMALAHADHGDTWASSIEPSVREGMLFNFAGQYDAADAIWTRLQQEYPTHPAGFLFSIQTLYWRQIYDSFDRSYDDQIEAQGRRALKLAKNWKKVHKDSARAHLFAGQAEIQLGRLDGVLKKYYAAGRHAERARNELDRALELDPEIIDAQYWLGMYFYYASTLPDILKWMSWLWFVPEPDAPRGLRELHQVSENGDIQQYSASLLLMNIYSYYEPDYTKAMQFATMLHTKFPDNTLIHFEMLELLLLQSRFDEVITEAKFLEAHAGLDQHDRGRAVLARVWRARAARESGHPGDANEILSSIDISDESIPPWGMAWIYLVQGQVYLDTGQPDLALEQFGLAADYSGESRRAAGLAQQAIANLSESSRG